MCDVPFISGLANVEGREGRRERVNWGGWLGSEKTTKKQLVARFLQRQILVLRFLKHSKGVNRNTVIKTLQ